jgi:Poly(R)-hydroxyalkanoic acid synthase subunit (PHA_synth_III_E)
LRSRFMRCIHMENRSQAGGSQALEQAFLRAVECFGRLLETLWQGPPPAGTGAPVERLRAALALELERWLRASAPILTVWPAATGFDRPAGAGPHAGGPRANLTPAAMLATMFAGLTSGGGPAHHLLGRWFELQARMAMHWSEIAGRAAQAFIARAGAPAASLGPQKLRELYDLWIDCAEQAYSTVVHGDDYSRTQAELINTATSIVLEQRAAVEAVARAYGIPTRSELDRLRQQVHELQTGRGAQSNRRRRRPGGNP